MDQGAHFFSCDFQVHSPRDRQWQGYRPATVEERKQYAREFVTTCRSKGIGAVAITDHHDMSFVSLIRDAARDEKDANGNALPEHIRMVVFPGMELTLGIPCQALLIFDANLPLDLFPLAFNALAITPAPDTDDRTAETKRLVEITSLRELSDLLDRHEFLRGRYIILPNVSEGGTSTLLRSGHAGHYKEMPCVGGYVDGDVGRLGDGNRGILSGKNAEYGNKKIAVFQTSDARSRDFAVLGIPSTWIKWATPTAEAIRQACLAQESRITHTQPFIPPIQITSIQVSNSKFLGPIVIELNPQYNAIIGGRGTGKSTILEYLRWGLSDEPPSDYSDEEDSDYRTKRRNLIEKTLVSLGGTVQISFLLNQVPHTVRRNSATGEILLKIADGNYIPCKGNDVRSLLPIQSYSQKQLSQVGIKLEELNRFVKQGIKADLDTLSKALSTTVTEIRSAFSRVLHKREIHKRLNDNQTELRSLEEQVRSLRTNLRGLDAADQSTISLQSSYEEADDFVNRLTGALKQAKSELLGLTIPKPDIAALPPTAFPELPDRQLVADVATSIEKIIQTSQEHLVALQRELGRLEDLFDLANVSAAAWQAAKDSYQKTYETAKTKSSAQQTTLDQLRVLENRLKAVRAEIGTLTGELEIIGQPDTQYAELRKNWEQLHRERAQKLESQCHLLTTLSDGLIKATLVKCADFENASSKLKTIISGTNIRTAKVESAFENIVSSNDPINEWSALLSELEHLAMLPKDSNQASALPPTPFLNKIGFSQSDAQKICSKLTIDSWLDLSLVVLDDQPKFEYRAREADYIPFADASAGQQATALLWALLSQQGPPLVMDQPEDDLDNQVISKVVEHIWKAKPKRQLIFTSHNANLVVNGDAELVICCDYRIAGDQSTGFVKTQGAIDVTDVRDEITKVMEGGKEAFKLRKDKYGF